MGMPGGGCFSVGAGQITDDSELALCLAHALISAGPAKECTQSSLQSAASNMYIEWLTSRPFDIGVFVCCKYQLVSSTDDESCL